MGKFDDKASMTVVNYTAMQRIYTDLEAIMGTLLDMYNKVSTLEASFTADYQGEAVDEVQMFLESLPIHILRLEKLYDKMEAFIIVTLQSLQTNDAKMVENMEN